MEVTVTVRACTCGMHVACMHVIVVDTHSIVGYSRHAISR